MMWKIILIVVGLGHLGSALFMWFAPQVWYARVPGVAVMGPYNLHFVRDIALIFLVSAMALVWGGVRRDQTACVIGALWPVFHAVFHLWIWGARGLPLDLVAVTNLAGVQVPGWLAVLATVQLARQEDVI